MLVFLLFASLELITGNFIEPWLYGAYTGISALALLVSTVFWTALWGAAGLILSTPLTVCVVVLGRHVPQFSFLHVILGDEAVLAPGSPRLSAITGHGRPAGARRRRRLSRWELAWRNCTIR